MRGPIPRFFGNVLGRSTPYGVQSVIVNQSLCQLVRSAFITPYGVLRRYCVFRSIITKCQCQPGSLSNQCGPRPLRTRCQPAPYGVLRSNIAVCHRPPVESACCRALSSALVRTRVCNPTTEYYPQSLGSAQSPLRARRIHTLASQSDAMICTRRRAQFAGQHSHPHAARLGETWARAQPKRKPLEARSHCSLGQQRCQTSDESKDQTAEDQR